MSARDVGLFVAVGILGALAVTAYGSPRWRQPSCEARWDLCAAALARSGEAVADLNRQLRARCPSEPGGVR